MKFKSILLLISILFSTSCSNMWLGTNDNDIALEGKRLNIISSEYQISPEDMLKNDLDLNTDLDFSNINKNWKISLGSYNTESFSYSPIYKDGFIFTLSDKNVVSCTNIFDKEIKWQVRVSPKNEDLTGIFGGGISLGTSSILVATGFGDILSISEETGGMIWRYSSISPFYSSPYVKDGMVFVTNRKNELLALDEDNGSILWKQKGTPEDVSILSNLNIVSDSKLIIPTYTSGEIFALHPTNGKKIWSDTLNLDSKTSNLANISNVASSSIIADGTLIASSMANKLVALDVTDGHRLWQKKISSITTPVNIGDTVFILTGDYNLLAISSANGGVYWQTNLKSLYPKDKDIKWSNLAIHNNNIVLNNSKKDILFISADSGKINLMKNIAYFTPSTPLFIDNAMFIIDSHNKLVSFRLN